MHHFVERDGEMYCEDVPVRRVAEHVGTPFYLYSHATLTRHYRVFDEAFEGIDHLICYSVKANANLALLRLFANLGSGFDIVSGGELFRVFRAGGDPSRVVFSGVGKSPEEIDAALEARILCFNVESAEELRAVDARAGRRGVRAPVSLRVNPDVDPKTHPYIATGLKKSKFGIPVGQALRDYERAKSLQNVEVVGLDCHIGSQITETGPFSDAVKRLRELIGHLQDLGIQIRLLDIGGGLGIPYHDETPPPPAEYARVLSGVLRELSGLGCTIVLEPGRVIVGNAGILVTRVLYRKETETKKFVVVDAAMNDLIRPALYGSFQEIRPVTRAPEKTIVADVVGPVCESGDFLARDREVPDFRAGDLVAVMSAGAYGFVMSSNYNARPRVPEVLVRGGEFYIVRARETHEDLVRGENVPEFLKS
jgi:diaminopimelate decarboxylase